MVKWISLPVFPHILWGIHQYILVYFVKYILMYFLWLNDTSVCLKGQVLTSIYVMPISLSKSLE